MTSLVSALLRSPDRLWTRQRIWLYFAAALAGFVLLAAFLRAGALLELTSPGRVTALSVSDVHFAIFVVTYALIISERVHKTTAALAGGMAIVALKVLDTEEAFEAIDLDVIFLPVGTMVIASGCFWLRYLAF